MTDVQRDAFQGYLDTLLAGPQCCYGPLGARAVGHALHVSANWKPGIREPADAELRALGPAAWQPLAAACSSAAGLVAASWTGRPRSYSGRSATTLCRGPLADVARWLPGGRRWTSAEPPPVSEVEAVNLAIQSGHSWVLVDCDRLTGLCDPRDGEPCVGLWALAADGTYSRPNGVDENGKWRPPVRYGCQPLRWEPLAVRAQRSRPPWACVALTAAEHPAAIVRGQR